MSRKKTTRKIVKEEPVNHQSKSNKPSNNFHIEFLNQAQKNAWNVIENNDITFIVGPAGSAKSFLSTAYAVKAVLSKTHRRIVLSRPVVEAGGEKIGYLPGMMEEKLLPYLMPIYDNLDEMVGKTGLQRELINKSMEVAPIAFLRGRSFHEAVCILDEAQNITYEQMVLYLTRIGRKGKLIINGDPKQSDLKTCCLMDIIKKLDGIPGIGIVHLDNSAIVRNPIISQILDRL